MANLIIRAAPSNCFSLTVSIIIAGQSTSFSKGALAVFYYGLANSDRITICINGKFENRISINVE